MLFALASTSCVWSVNCLAVGVHIVGCLCVATVWSVCDIAPKLVCSFYCSCVCVYVRMGNCVHLYT